MGSEIVESVPLTVRNKKGQQPFVAIGSSMETSYVMTAIALPKRAHTVRPAVSYAMPIVT